MAPHTRPDFTTLVLEGVAELGRLHPWSGDLSLELGISLWLRRSDTAPGAAVDQLLDVRRTLIEVADLDPDREPVPLLGRSTRLDLVVLVAGVAALLERATLDAARRQELICRVSAAVCEPGRSALGA
jgi:hypothetical protein